MKPNYKRGVISLVIYGLLLLSAAGFFQYVATQSTPDKLASEGYVLSLIHISEPTRPY